MNEITNPDELTEAEKNFFAARFLDLEKHLHFAMQRGEVFIDTGKRPDGFLYAAAQVTVDTPKGPDEQRKIRYGEEMPPYIYTEPNEKTATPAYRVGLILQAFRKLTEHVRRREAQGTNDWVAPDESLDERDTDHPPGSS